MSNNGGFSTSGVSIPNTMRKTIQNIREIAKNHSDDDIYAMLKECSMDPNETTQRLLHLDTFHQVKSKRHKRKEAVESRPGEDSRWKPGHQVRGILRARGNTYSQYSTDDSGGRRINVIQKENGVEKIRGKVFRSPTPSVLKKIDTVQPCHVDKALSIPINGPASKRNGNLGGVYDSKTYRIDPYYSKESIGAAGSDSLPTIRPNDSAVHAPSASDPVLIPSGNSWISTAVGAIKREVRIDQTSIVSSAHIPVNNGLGKTESSSSHLNQSGPQKIDLSPASSSSVVKEASQPANVAATNVLREFAAAEKSHVPSSVSAVRPSSLQGVGPPSGVEKAASELVKLKIFDGQHVIIPDHIQVPDAVKNVLSFGSIDASFRVACVKNKNIKDLHSAGDVSPDKTTEVSSSCDKDAVSTVRQADHTDNQRSQSNLPDENYPVDTKVSSSAISDDQLKEDNLPAVGPPFPIVQTTPSYSFGFMPPMLANTLLQSGGSENQAHFSSSPSGDSPAGSSLSSKPPPTQCAGVGQASITVSPQAIPLFSQLYPPNYIPYSHYCSPFYVPPTIHQYYGQTVFSQPLPTGNVLLPTSTAMKNSPTHFRPGANVGNQAPTGVPSGYGVHNPSQVGFSPNAAVTSGNLSTSEGLTPTALKDKNIYSGQQSEVYGAWLPTANFPINSFLNFPQGQHVINPQSLHGAFSVYHTLQPMPSTAPGQPVTGQVQSVSPPSNTYQHSQ